MQRYTGKFTFADPEKIRKLAGHGEASRDSEGQQVLEHAIEIGRGGVYVRLTPGSMRVGGDRESSLMADAHDETGSNATGFR